MGNTTFYEGILSIINIIDKINNDKDISIDVEFHLVGDISKVINEYKMYKNTDISKIFESKFIKLYGKVPHNEAIKIISTFDLYVIPRLDLPVTNMVSPIKPYEPMSLKIPLLMSDCDALKDISENGKNCMIFRKNNNKDFYNKLKKIILNGYSKEILNNAYEFVKKERNWRNIIKKIDLYNII
jgi:glycosyltransferase involved in cell wall biosynthesis